MMHSDELKKQVVQAALSYIKEGMIIGAGTGATANYFIEALSTSSIRIEGAVPSSLGTAAKLKACGIPVLDINSGPIALYIDSADECTPRRELIKGGGGALTREKIVAACSEQFLCLIEERKYVKVLGAFALPIEVIPMARSYVAREIVKLGANPMLRENFITDNGNQILDIYNLNLVDPSKVEQQLNNITGVVCNGVFAIKPADIVLMATEKGVIKID